MATKKFNSSKQANESISKYKLLSAYGGPGSLIHTQYGSIMISCIEEWGFLNKVLEIQKDAGELGKNEDEVREYVINQSRLGRNGNIGISNDTRLLNSLVDRKELSNLKYLVLMPDIELKEYNNEIKDNKTSLSISSTFMPKVFSNKRTKLQKTYGEWYNEWVRNSRLADRFGNKFFPPKAITDEKKGWTEELVQDNIVLICDSGHISDFPWSQFLRWRKESPNAIYDNNVRLLESELCCGTLDNPSAKISITSSTANASGFEGKWLKCGNCRMQVSLKGIMGLKIKCSGHKPWEADTGKLEFYSGDKNSRNQTPATEACRSSNPMKVVLTTGNNLYYSRSLSSIYMPDELFLDDEDLKRGGLEKDFEQAKLDDNLELAIEIRNTIKELDSLNDKNEEESLVADKDLVFRYQEYKAFSQKAESEINIDKKNEHLKVKDVTKNLDSDLSTFFSKILRVDNMKLTTAQLDFSRVVPDDSDGNGIVSKNIFRSFPQQVEAYPVVENYGEGIFFAFSLEMLENYVKENEVYIQSFNLQLEELNEGSSRFSTGAISYGVQNNWQLYLIHSFSHLIMRELEFRCGYPTSSLSERLYVSNEDGCKMFGLMIFTAEGAEGSMGGLIAQTTSSSLNMLIRSALKRATICSSDPLCWESEGQGLFDLNFASCFSCSLVSETSCEHRNLYLDRKILVDDEVGFFKSILEL